MYTYAAKVWDLSVVQGPLSVTPCQTDNCPQPKEAQLLSQLDIRLM
jgi:hypothetical protein